MADRVAEEFGDHGHHIAQQIGRDDTGQLGGQLLAA